MKLSMAIQRGPGLDPLRAAALASMATGARERFDAADADTQCKRQLRHLHEQWPELGLSVRRWSKLAAAAERYRLILRLRNGDGRYRPDAHISLWGLIAALFANHEYSKGDIADLLATAGL